MILSITIFKIIGEFLLVAVIHELTHFIFAKIYKREYIKINVKKIYYLSVSYKNNHNPSQNLVIAISAPCVCVFIGLTLIILGQLNFLTLIFLLNILNFLPITQDGQMILISIIDILKNRKNV
ncbi:metalloprotease family protein (plasmid) [Staphylococcus xylosus]|uniref:metalloprotease family protein n=1 Tax=Staphylococcus xylosus TaxID=1288 RepID=UPI00403ED61F